MKIKETADGLGFYLNQNTQFHHVFDELLEKADRADMMIISSFAITEALVRRIVNNRYRIMHLDLFLDFTIASRNMSVTCFAGANVDRLFLINNHSKTIYIRSKSGDEYLAVMSNNATNNHRYECGFNCKNNSIISIYLDEIEQMKLESLLFDGRK